MNIDNFKWPGWETVGLIGRGSFGDVYEIKRNGFDKTEKAALKIISIPQNSSEIEEMYNDGYDEKSIIGTFDSHLKSILAEYSMMREMADCENIVKCDDVRYEHQENGVGWNIYIKMELLTPLTKAVPVVVSEETVIKLAKDICTALVCCKKHNIVHRDIKPQNIFVSENGDYKLGDFGIAKTVEKTMGGTKIGTYKYMAPEVYNNQPYGTAADIYSLGLVLYWMLNNRRMPFVSANTSITTVSIEEETRMRRLSGEMLPEPANGSKALKTIVMKACAFNSKDRYSSAREMLDELKKLSKDCEDKCKVVLPFEIDEEVTIDECGGTTDIETVEQDFDAVTETVESEKDDLDRLDVKEDTNKNNRARVFPLWAKIVIPIVGIVLVVLAVLLGTGVFGSNDDLVEVPKVTEMDYYDAIKKLESKGLSVDIDNCTGVVDTNYDNNCVISQDPLAGTTVQKGTKIILTYTKNELELETDNKGAATLPDFSLRDKDEVIIFLTENAYEYSVEEINDDVVGKGKVVKQEISGKKVVLYVSIGPKAEKIHSVKGKQYEQARNELETLGLIVIPNYVENNSMEAGTVIDQSIKEGCEVFSGDEIIITIATNKPLVKIPDVKGKAYSDAKSDLQSCGLSVQEEEIYSREVAKGQVIKTYPEAGNSVEEESIVVVYVSKGKQSVTVTYDDKGKKTESLQYVGDTYKNLPKPQRTGYTFSGWYYNGQPVTSQTVVEVANDHTLTAKWTEGKYTVTFNTNGAGSVNPIAVNYDEVYGDGLPSKLTKTGYIFKGWKDSSGNTITKKSKVKIAGNHSLTAEWEPIKYYIKYNANGGTSATMSNSTHTYDEEKALKLNAYKRTGYEFMGWAISADGIKKYNDGQTVKNLTTTNGYTYNLYAKWSANSYTIKYNANGGSGAPTNQTKYHDSSITLSSTKPSRTGYTFIGWSESSTATSATYQPSDRFTGNKNTTLYAVWQKNTYTIVYNANGGSGAPTNQTKYHDSSITLSSTKPSRTGYTFIGWSESSTATSAIYQPSDKFTGNKNTTLYAVWKNNIYTISFNANGGTVSQDSKTVQQGEKYGILPTPTRDGYTFNGWYTSKNGGNKVSADTIMKDSNVTLYAQWSQIAITITEQYSDTCKGIVYYSGSKSLTVNGVPSGQSVTWTTSNSSVISLNKTSGNKISVSGKYIGSATVTATLTGTNISASVTLSVPKPVIKLSSYSGSRTQSATSSTYHLNGDNVTWWYKIELPKATVSNFGMGACSVSGWGWLKTDVAFIENDVLYVNQPGVYTVTYEHSGADPVTYTYTLKFTKTTTALNYMYSNCPNSPNSNNAISTVPKNVTVSITQLGYSNYGVWGKCTYNGKTGWIIISKYS